MNFYSTANDYSGNIVYFHFVVKLFDFVLLVFYGYEVTQRATEEEIENHRVFRENEKDIEIFSLWFSF